MNTKYKLHVTHNSNDFVIRENVICNTFQNNRATLTRTGIKTKQKIYIYLQKAV